VIPVYATRGALRAAERLLPGRCLEVEVEKAMLAGGKHRDAALAERAGERFVVVDENVVAALARRRSPLTRRPSWMVTRLLPLRSLPHRRTEER
jgi:hypothetical protein